MSKKEKIERMKMDRMSNQGKVEDKSKAYVSSLQTYNWVYVINTLLRYVGSWFHNSLLNQVISRQTSGLVFSLVGLVSLQSIVTWIERLKSMALFSGLIFSYFYTERRRDVNWTTTWWLTYSGMSFLILILINQGFNRSVVGLQSFVILIGLSDILYGFLLGIRDGQRPRAFAFLARKLSSHSVEASDQVKSLLDNRKISTTIAEMVGMYFFLYILKEFKINLETGMLLWMVSICSMANFLCAIYFHYTHRNLDLNDSLMSPEQSRSFPSEVRGWLRGFLNLKSLNFRYLIDFTKRTLSLRKVGNDQGSYKMHLFISNFIILKCLFCFSKSNFFQVASSCCNYLPIWEKYARSIILLILFYDLSKSYYRKRTGKHLIKSLDMLGLVTFFTILSKLLVWIGQYTNDARPIVFLAYPFYIFAQGLCVQALNHLFEVWGIESAEKKRETIGEDSKAKDAVDVVIESPALVSIKYNALSIGSHVLGKFLNHTWLQFIFSVVSIIFNLKLRSLASEAESI